MAETVDATARIAPLLIRHIEGSRWIKYSVCHPVNAGKRHGYPSLICHCRHQDAVAGRATYAYHHLNLLHGGKGWVI